MSSADLYAADEVVEAVSSSLVRRSSMASFPLSYQNFTLDMKENE